MAVDYGEKNVGIAVSDPLGIIAQPLGTVSPKAENVRELVKKYNVEKIIVGLPLHMNGSEGKSAKDAKAFAEAIKNSCGVPVEMLDERFTTKEAERILIEADVSRKKRKGKIDKLSAALLLEHYMQSRNENAL